jgi:hypothetical protein
MVERVEQHITKREIEPHVNREVKNIDKVIVKPLIQRVEVHTTQKEIAPTTKTETQNIEKLEVQPYIQREEQHVTRKEIAPVIKRETKDINKKVIQPIIKDVIQPVHIKINPVLQEGIKPTIYQGQKVHQVINQGTQNLPASFQGTKYEKEITSGTSVRTSIVKESVLPTDFRGTQMKPEIVGNAASTVHIEQNTTTVRPSIVKTSVLPTQDGGTRVLQTQFGGTTSTIENQFGGTTSVVRKIETTTTEGGMSMGAGGSIIGVGGGVGDDAADVTYSTKPNNPFASNIGNVNVKKITTTTTTTQYGGGAGSVIGVGGGIGDNAVDVTYSTKPNNQSTLGAMTTSRVLPPMVGQTSVRPVIVQSSMVNPI